MVHTFTMLDKCFLLDVNTCSLYEIDNICLDLVPFFENGQDYSCLENKYSKNELDEAYLELTELKTKKLAFNDIDWENVVDKNKVSHDIKAMCLHVSHDCELRCKYCFASTGSFHGSREFMSYEVGQKALEFLATHSGKRTNLEVDFFGGEPLLNWDVVKRLMTYGKELEKKYNKTFRFTMTTNGIGLTDEILKDFEELYNVVISIDGRKEVHEFMRPDINGKSTYDKIVNSATKLKSARGEKSYYIRGTYTNQNLDFSNDVLDMVEKGFDQISVEPVVLDEKSKFAIKPEHLENLFKEYETLAKKYIEYREHDDTWFNFFHFMIDMENGPCISKRLIGCGAGNEYIAVTPSGDIYPCHQFVGNKEYVMGSVVDGSYNRDMQKTFSKNHVLNKPKCKDCWCKFFCSGGCIANAVNFTGKMYEPYEMSCEIQKKRTECALAIYAIEKENNSLKSTGKKEHNNNLISTNC